MRSPSRRAWATSSSRPEPGNRGHGVLFGQFPRGVLQAEIAHLLRRWADERDARCRTGFGKAGVFTEKTVAGVDGLGTRGTCGFQNFRLIQIAFGCGSRADEHSLIGFYHMACVAVRLGVDRHGSDPHFLQGSNDATRNSAAIGNEYFMKHR